MLAEFRKSVSSILYERTTSPLYGAFFFSWSVWNWKVLYATFFVSEDKLPYGVNKLDYITRFLTCDVAFIFPIVSSIGLVLIIPFVGNGAYWVSLRFRKWRLEKKAEVIDKGRLLTLDDSTKILSDMNELDFKFDKILRQKENEIKALSDRVNSSYQRVYELEQLRIISAVYQGPTRTKDVTDIVMTKGSFNHANNTMNPFRVGNESFTDPEPGLQKKLVLIYLLKGEVKRIEAFEGQYIGIIQGVSNITDTPPAGTSSRSLDLV